MIALTPLDLALAAILVVLLAGLTILLHLGLWKQIVIAGLRTTVQLFLIGFVLKWIFRSDFLFITALALVMLLAAGREAVLRQKRRFVGIWGFSFGALAMFLSSFTITFLALVFVIHNEPWYLPQYAIPILGMMLGNTMNGIALGLDRLTTTAWQGRAVIEGRLMLGQTWSQAIGDIRKDSIRSALIPIINAMSIAGLVSLPGMMTGQILAGNPPLEAVKYQILIMFMIASGTGFGSLAAVYLASRRLFDERGRLRLDRLRG
ncbi:iron export ABC transporter permease subunit FetB [candidate division KSB1 bacterium]|nr:iron export ABC transporter permease subunit FetB [candidate division KSB1 bacterium]RQW11429.1 MAG: iron export ABC transporter permease subunit FetB [candidate division KSB1 bacterium]